MKMKPGTRTNQLRHQFKIVGYNALYQVLHGKLTYDKAIQMMGGLRTLWMENPEKNTVEQFLKNHNLLKNTSLDHYA